MLIEIIAGDTTAKVDEKACVTCVSLRKESAVLNNGQCNLLGYYVCSLFYLNNQLCCMPP